LLKKP